MFYFHTCSFQCSIVGNKAANKQNKAQNWTQFLQTMIIICLISSVFICLSNTASFHQLNVVQFWSELFWAEYLNVCKIAVITQSVTGGEHWLRQVSMNIRRSGHWIHFVSKQCKSIQSLAHLWMCLVFWKSVHGIETSVKMIVEILVQLR